ncbi:hypothetical protein J5I95_24450 [Candidatus Poribacteria bacterium]|nr:hypothetical protein [Candidatus Poribacteria bacterium]
MAKVSVSAAVKLTGIPKSSLYRDISTGKVSATTDDRDKKVIDTAELVRVYGKIKAPRHPDNGNAGTPKWDDLGQNGNSRKAEKSNTDDANHKIIAVLEQQVAQLKAHVENATQRETKLIEMLTAEQEKTRLLILPTLAEKSSLFQKIKTVFRGRGTYGNQENH